jgi:LysM repeat protein
LNINAARCSVCGSTLSASVSAASSKAVQASRLPEVTLSLPVVIGLAVLLLVIGAGAVYAFFQSTMPGTVDGAIAAATLTETPTVSPTITLTPTPEASSTPEATFTPLPPIQYTVISGDTCLSIALTYGVATNSIITLNQLSPECILSVGRVLNIPQPTPTPSPQPTNTLNATQQAQTDCEKLEYIVKDGDTLGGIAGSYGVSQAAIREFTGMNSDVVMVGMKVIIPLCIRSLEPATATPVPPYPAPNLLLPADGTSFKAGDLITLQWAAVGDLRQNEAYAVTIIDITDGGARKLVDYVPDTKFNIPETFRPAATVPHIFYWTVLPVRQVGTNKDTGAPVWEPAGSVSAQRSFSWTGNGGAAPAPSATP